MKGEDRTDTGVKPLVELARYVRFSSSAFASATLARVAK